MQTLVDLLKFLVGLAVIVWFGYFWWTHGLPQSGRLRWRNDRYRRSGRKERHK